MVEAHRFDQRDVIRRHPPDQMLLCIPVRVVNLREPLAQVDAATKVLRTLLSTRRIVFGEGRKGQKKAEKNQLTHGSSIELQNGENQPSAKLGVRETNPFT